MEQMNLSNCSGIYLILNIIDWKAYVGQTVNFNNRDHIYELEKGKDRTAFQRDYDEGTEFVYMIAYYDPDKEIKGATLDTYEQMYMTLMENFGFSLYNEQHNKTDQARENRSISNLGIDEDFYLDAKKEFNKDFKERFGISPVELSESSNSRRKEALEYYAKERLKLEKFAGDRFLFNRQRIQSLFNNNSRSIRSLDINEMFISKAGNYLGEGIDQIVNYELTSINKNNYCLWTFAYNAVSHEVVKKRCVERQQMNKDIYVLFEYTPSNVYASSEQKQFGCLKKENAKELTDDELDFLSFERGKNGDLYVPADIDCTATATQSTSAFVIQELFLLDEVFDSNSFNDYYQAIRRNNELQDISKGGFQRCTHYIKRSKDFKLDDVLEKSVRRKFCFVGKLAAPYILLLNNKKFD